MVKMYIDQNQSITGVNTYSATQYYINSIGFGSAGTSILIGFSGNDMIFADYNTGPHTLSDLAAGGGSVWPPTVTADLDMNSYDIYNCNALQITTGGKIGTSYNLYVPSPFTGWIDELDVKKVKCDTSSTARLRLPVGSNMYN